MPDPTPAEARQPAFEGTLGEPSTVLGDSKATISKEAVQAALTKYLSGEPPALDDTAGT